VGAALCMFTTIKELKDDFIEFYEREGYSESTITNHEIRLRKYILPVIGDKYIRSLTVDDVSYVKEKARKAGHSLATSTTTTVRMLLRFAENENYTVGVDWEEIDVPQYSSKPAEVQYFNKEQLQIVREAIPTTRPSGLRTRALFELLLHTGLRLSEALKLDKKDVDFQKNVINAYNTKRDEYQEVHVSDYALDWLEKYLSMRVDDDKALFYVIPKCGGGGERLCAETAKSYMKKLAKDTDLPVGHHILRRTFGTELMRLNDVDPKTAQSIMRHKDIRTTMDHYVGVAEERQKYAHEQTTQKLTN
jgi:site-specific recombinase XerD